MDPEHQVTLTNGATEGVPAALLACVDPGDEVLVPEPWFESYPGAVRLVGAVPRPVPLTLGDRRLDFADPREGGRWIRTSFVRDPEIMDQGMKTVGELPAHGGVVTR